MDRRLIIVPIWGSPRPSLTKNGRIMQFLRVLRLIVPAKVRASHGPTSEETVRAFCEAPSASAR